jgi:sulfite exporter TauE/SafE
LYNLGRIATYAMLGALAGLAGAALAFEGAQAKVASIAGVLLIIVALMQVLPKLRLNFFSHVYQVISRFISPRLKNAGAGRFVLLGLLNGFLPCGMVAAALVVSIAAETVAEGVLYMAVYGLGTLPMMLTASLMGFYLAARTKRILTIVGPVYSLAVGVLLLVRPALIAPHCG